MPRLFLGTYLTEIDQLALGQVAKHNANLRTAWNCRIIWSKPNQLHLTWIFFGDVVDNNIDNLCQAISKTLDSSRTYLVRTDSSLVYETLECWFAHRRPQLLTLVPSTINTNLLAYASNVRIQLSEYAAEDVRQQPQKPFKPHITLARLANIEGHKPHMPLSTNNELLPDAIDGLVDLLPLTHILDTMSLIESREHNGLHQYNTIKNFSLFDYGNHEKHN